MYMYIYMYLACEPGDMIKFFVHNQYSLHGQYYVYVSMYMYNVHVHAWYIVCVAVRVLPQTLDPDLEAELGRIRDTAPRYRIWTKFKVQYTGICTCTCTCASWIHVLLA